MILYYDITELDIFDKTHAGDSSDLDGLLKEMVMR